MRTKIIIISFFYFFVLAGFAQSQYQNVYDYNLKVLDSAEQNFRNVFCNGDLRFQEQYNSRYIRQDVQVIDFLNETHSNTLTISKLDRLLTKIKFAKAYKNVIRNGLIDVVNVIINGKYIRVKSTIEFIRDRPIREQFLITFSTHGSCIENGMDVLDFKILRIALLKAFKFPIRIRDVDILVNDYYLENVQAFVGRVPGYKLIIPKRENENWQNNIIKKQFNYDSSCCYSLVSANKDFITMIKNDKIPLIEDLLYSPNYFYSVNAMEALIYLESINRIVLNGDIKEKVAAIKQGTDAITIQKSPDLYSTVKGYKEINLTNQQIINKYKYLLHR